MRSLHGLFSLAFALTLGGCSAIGLDDFDRCDELGATPAEQASACAQALNGSFGLPGWCSPWQCVEGRCVRTDDELCDAADNDCDGLVDEGVFTPTPIGTAEVMGSPSSLDGASGNESAWARYTTTNAAANAATIGTALTDVGPQSYVRHAPVDASRDPEDIAAPRREEDGCWRLDLSSTGEGPTGALLGTGLASASCDFDVLDVEMDRDVGLAATLSRGTSADGLVRIGHVDATEPRRLAALGPSALSNSFLGVARDGSLVRSALDPQACAEATDASATVRTCPEACDLETEICLEGRCAPRACSPMEPGSCVHEGLTCGQDGLCRARSCTMDAECGSALRCASNRCRQRCTDDASCGDESLVCESSGACVPRPCEADSECGDGDSCACGRCLHPRQIQAARACGVADLDLAISAAPPGSADSARLHGVVTLLGGSRSNYPLGCVIDDVEGTTPDESTRDVALLGAWFQRSSGDSYSVVNVTDEGRPTALGTTRSGSAPATVTLATGLFLVGFADAQSAFSLRPVSLPAARAAVVSSCDEVALPPPATLPHDYYGTQMCGAAGAMQESFCLQTRCGSDVGECTSGRPVCWGGEALCEGITLPRPEECANGADEDCDGETDESECIPACEEKAETCNGVDDDCDGLTDEALGGATCTADELCGAGTTVCIGGVEICVGADRVPSDRRELCGNGADDDCDGDVDEGSCQACQSPRPSTDICDGTDNDCDGVIDENAPGQNQKTCATDFDCDMGRSCGAGGVCQSTTNDFRPEAFVGSTPRTNRDPSVIRQCLQTDAPMVGDAFSIPAEGIEGRVEDLQIAVGPASPDAGMTLGFTWREVRPGGDVIRFRSARFLTDCSCVGGGMCNLPSCDRVLRPTSVRDTTMPVTLSTAGAVGAPTLVYVPSGVLAVGGPRGADTVRELGVGGQGGGGWHVLWQRYTSPDGRSDGRIELRTVAAHDGLPTNVDCDAESEATCATTIAGEGANARFVDTFRRGDVPGFAWVDDRTLAALTLTCGG